MNADLIEAVILSERFRQLDSQGGETLVVRPCHLHVSFNQ